MLYPVSKINEKAEKQVYKFHFSVLLVTTASALSHRIKFKICQTLHNRARSILKAIAAVSLERVLETSRK